MSDTEVITYQFAFADGTSREFSVELRQPSLELVPVPLVKAPEWTALTFRQCPNCPLREDDPPHCPIARNLVPMIEAFQDRMSYDEVEVTVQGEARTYRKSCSLQEGVSSLMGLIMPTSGCPYLDKLRPMVFTHLPFATPEQTTYRAVSMYLLAQFFRQQHGQTPDWELKDLSRSYDDIHRVNRAFAKRLASIQEKDANRNAIVKLDNFARITAFSIAEQWWEDIESIFRPYLADTLAAVPTTVSLASFSG